MLGEKWSAELPAGRVRAFNLWILERGSIQANTLPSAHVAIAGACALSLLRLGPLWAGAVFLWIAVSIALGAVSGRYHYALDAILGFVVAGIALLVGVILLP
jgi:membrane-associated phospholipid phosphatase